MHKHLWYAVGILVLGCLIYLASTGLLSTVFGYVFLAVGIAAPLLLSYFIQRDLLFPHWVILLWTGLMVATVGVIAEPTLLHPVGYLICPEGYATPEVKVKTEILYDGASNTSATLYCRGAAGLIESDSLKALAVSILLYLLVFLPLLIIAAIVGKVRRQAWGAVGCFALSTCLYCLLMALAWVSPGLHIALRAAVQQFF